MMPPKTTALRKNHDFQLVYKKGKSFAAKHIVIIMLKNGRNVNRLGVSASKKVGNAVIRNLVRRRLKEAYRLIEAKADTVRGHDIVILPRAGLPPADFADYKTQLEYLLRKHGILAQAASAPI